MVTIKAENMIGKRVELRMSADASLADLQLVLQDKFEMPVNRQRLLINGTDEITMSADKPISECHFSPRKRLIVCGKPAIAGAASEHPAGAAAADSHVVLIKNYCDSQLWFRLHHAKELCHGSLAGPRCQLSLTHSISGVTRVS